MSDFLNRLIAEDEPEEREVTFDGETGSVWFRRVSGGERAQLLQGLKVSHVPGTNEGTVDVDLGNNEHQKHLLVQFSVCTEEGKRVFKTIRDVEKIPNRKLKVLLAHAEAVNKDLDDDLGKG